MKSQVLMMGIVVSLWAIPCSAGSDTLDRCAKAADLWKAAYNKGDIATLMAFYDEKSVVSTANWTAGGIDNVKSAWTAELAVGGKITSITCEASRLDGSLNIAHGSWSASLMGPDGKQVTLSGHWQNNWRWKSDNKDDGTFTLETQFNNTQMPPPAKK